MFEIYSVGPQTANGVREPTNEGKCFMSKSKKLSAYVNRSLNRSRVNLSGKVTGSRQSVLDDIYAGLETCFGPADPNRIESKLASPTFQGSEEQNRLIKIIDSITDEPLAR